MCGDTHKHDVLENYFCGWIADWPQVTTNGRFGLGLFDVCPSRGNAEMICRPEWADVEQTSKEETDKCCCAV
jgi:hypothetical protein